jgi:hypothetical protein
VGDVNGVPSPSIRGFDDLVDSPGREVVTLMDAYLAEKAPILQEVADIRREAIRVRNGQAGRERHVGVGDTQIPTARIGVRRAVVEQILDGDATARRTRTAGCACGSGVTRGSGRSG